MNSPNNDALVAEMQDIKKLIILQLLALDYKQKDIAAVLGISNATLSRMISKVNTKDTAKRSTT